MNRSQIWPVLIVLITMLPASAAPKGTIRGTVEDPKSVKSIRLVNRKTKKSYAAKFNQQNGRFEAAGLPIKATFDCIVDYKFGRLEGVNFKVKRSDYEEEQPLSKEDRKIIRRKVLGLNKFTDQVKILAIKGNIQHAAILIHKLRTKPFFDSKPGEVIWRAELWHFQRPEETWLKDLDELWIVLYRERIQRAVFDKKSVTFDPKLGGISITAKRPTHDLGTIKTPSRKRGVRLRPAPSVGKKTKPKQASP